jgi:uncharacterized protein
MAKTRSDQRLATTLFETSVPTFLQTERAIGGCLSKAAADCDATGMGTEVLVTARLYPDMAPFWFQIDYVDNYSVCRIEAMLTGSWTLPDLARIVPFADLQARIAQSVSALEEFRPDEMDT